LKRTVAGDAEASLDDVFMTLTERGALALQGRPPMSDLSLVPPRTSPATEARTLIVRALRLTLRNPEALPTAFVLPVILLLMFVYLFGGAIHTGTHYVDYVVPGVVLVCVGFGAATTAVSVSHDLTSGVIDRFRSIDVRGEILTGGHVIASVLRNLCSMLIVFAVALAVGFRPHGGPAACLAAVGILVLYVLALSWFAAAVGILAKSSEAAQGITFFVSFLAYPSSAFVPIRTMPAGLRACGRSHHISL
jgi:ABC-2 type transport system permease protein